MRHRNSMWMAGEHVGSIRDQVVSSARSQRLDSQTGVGRSLGWEHAAITNEEVGNVMRAPKAICDRCLRIVTHARATNEVCIARFLHDLLSSSRVHNLHCFCDTCPGN